MKKIDPIRKLKRDLTFQPFSETWNSFIFLCKMKSLKLKIEEELKKMYKDSFIIFDEKILFLFFIQNIRFLLLNGEDSEFNKEI